MCIYYTGFNPRTHIGCDIIHRDWNPITISFNPRTHAGCDQFQGLHNHLFQRFNPRTHAGCESFIIVKSFK